ncbi:hypothetical protein [Parasphingopyxis marina]|uniref:DUF8021 domain-containing protein n=1 Tax=Parasphingopyxis marina TaxID=2761622 RepID=A0A842HVR9_9SPHN|nr:hypothetical protein [Parasphingopyxis marina]MBC2777196.1 hypothetical protein [Parasphingopyxis marina]
MVGWKRVVALGLMSLLAAVPAHALQDGACDRQCLDGFANAYLDALIANDPSALPMDADVKYSENQSLLRVGEGAWQTARELGDYRIYVADPGVGQVGFIGNIRLEGGWTMIALRLKIRGRRIVEVESVIPGPAPSSAGFSFGDAAANLATPRAIYSQTLEPAQRRDRGTLIFQSDLHYEGVERGNGDIVPFANDCLKIENGVQLIRNPDFPFPAASPSGRELPNFSSFGCRDQFNTHIWDTDTVTDRRYPIVDRERGIVFAFVMYHQYLRAPCANVVDYGTVCPPAHVEPFTLVLAEAFRLSDGEIQGVEAVFTALPTVRLRGVW